MAILTPVVLLLLFTALQAGMWFYARSIALSAAQQCVQNSRGTAGTAGAGQQAGTDFVTTTGGGTLHLDSVAVTPGLTVTCVVTGTSTSLIPGVSLPVSQTASGPEERPTQ